MAYNGMHGIMYPDRYHPQNQQRGSTEKRKGMGCFLKGCLITIVVFILGGAGLLALGAFTFHYNLKAYASAEPWVMFDQNLDSKDYTKTLDYLSQVRKEINSKASPEVRLSLDDLNLYLAKHSLVEKSKAKISFYNENGLLMLKGSIPIEKLFFTLKGYCNFQGYVTFSVHEGRLNIRFEDYRLNGEPTVGFFGKFIQGFTRSYFSNLFRSILESDSVFISFSDGFDFRLEDQNLVLIFKSGNFRNTGAILQPKESNVDELRVVPHEDSLETGLTENKNVSLPFSNSTVLKTPENTAIKQNLNQTNQFDVKPVRSTSGKYIGKTLEEVKQNLGRPLATGEDEDYKMIYYYDSFEVYSHDGKIVSAEQKTR